MDKRVVFAVAGSGKTSLIISSLSLEQRALILTYTEANQSNLRRKIIERFGCVPDNIKVMGYFSFLYQFCYLPFLSLRLPAREVWTLIV